MLADRSDLEPLDDVPEPIVADEPGRRAPAGWAVLIVALAIAVAGATFAVTSRRQLVEAEAELARAQQQLGQARDERDQAEADLGAAVVAEAERDRARARADEAERFDANADRFVLRDPVVTLPADVRLCRADDLEVVPPDGPVHGLTVGNRTTRPCGLLDHPILQGLDEGGRWRTIPTQPSMASSYTDGPEWTGVVVRGRAAILRIAHGAPLRSGHCMAGPADPEDFSGLRLVLSPQAEPLVVPGATFSLGPCRPEVLLWDYDHEGM